MRFKRKVGSRSLRSIRNSVIEIAVGGIGLDGPSGISATPVRVPASEIIGTTSGSNLTCRNRVDGSFNAIP